MTPQNRNFTSVFDVQRPAGLEMGQVKTAFSCDWQEVNHAFRSVFHVFMLSMTVNSIVI